MKEVGAADPTLRNSPIVDLLAQEEPPVLDDAVPEACYFNGEAYAHGSFVVSGGSVLRCENGVWAMTGRELEP